MTNKKSKIFNQIRRFQIFIKTSSRSLDTLLSERTFERISERPLPCVLHLKFLFSLDSFGNDFVPSRLE
jgi:hypothetical protein